MWRVGIDVGGTFTDLVAVEAGGGRQVHLKVSTNVGDPAAGFMDAIAALRRETGIDAGQIGTIFHGTTLATNAIIERNISKTALITTKGFRDILEIGRHWREDLYDLDLERPAAWHRGHCGSKSTSALLRMVRSSHLCSIPKLTALSASSWLLASRRSASRCCTPTQIQSLRSGSPSA
jgi:N-methylhydantoinase A/oxoprolinase/acetone carboxylase beta subunit